MPKHHHDLTDASYERLKAHILQRYFQPNEKLSVDRMAQQLGVSRTPAKDALNRLATDGLVTIQPRVGSFVTPLTAQDVREIFEVRQLIEQYAAGQATFPRGAVDEMAAIVQQMAGCIDDGRYRTDKLETFIELDSSLHRLIVSQACNQRLLAIYDSLNVHLHIMRAYYVREMGNAVRGQQEHEQIVDACRRGDTDALKQVLREHISAVRDLVLEIIETNGGII